LGIWEAGSSEGGTDIDSTGEKVVMSRGPMAMDVSDGGVGEEVVVGGGRGRSAGPLAVNKASSKIAKGLRRPVTQPRPAPHIYKTEPSDFRSLVQQLTGTSSSSSSSGGALATAPAAPGPAPTKPAVSRLHKIAPPPLRPTFAYPSLPQQQPPNAAALLKPLPISAAPSFSPLRFGGFSPHSTQRVSPFPVSPLSFSPLPALTPSDSVWATSTWSSLEFPKDGLLQQQQQQQVHSAAAGAAAGEGNNYSISRNDFSTSVDPFPAAHIPWQFPAPPPLSPKFAIPFGLPTPTGLGSFGMFGMNSTFSPTAAFMLDANFSFPEPDIGMSAPTTP